MPKILKPTKDLDGSRVRKLSNDLKISFPVFNSKLSKRDIVVPVPISTGLDLEKDKNIKFRLDYESKLLIIESNTIYREYPFSYLSNYSSRSSNTISKNDAIELANDILKLGIKPQNKKNVFIKAIREKVGLPSEDKS